MRTRSTLFFLLAALGLSSSIKTKAQVNVQDSLALVALYDSTNGTAWHHHTNWKTGPVATWDGITVSDTRVTQLELEGNNITGIIPSEFGNLSKLVLLDVWNNNITGLSPGFGNLSGLVTLMIPGNQLTTLPPEIGNLGNLYYLYLWLNELKFLPPEIANLKNLRELVAYSNQITNLPPEFGNMPLLETLDLSFNEIKGSIPPELGNMAHLSGLYLGYNKLSGAIPPSIADLSLHYAFVDLSHNGFTFNGMELFAQKLPYSVYNKQKRIPIHIDNNVLSVSAGGTLSNNTYHWYGANPNGHANEIILGDSTFHPTKSGIYYVRVFNSIATELTLRSDTFYYKMPVVNAFSDNSMQVNDNKAFSVYPNPANNILNIQTNGTASFTLTNQEGKSITTTTINGKGFMYVSSFAPGIYYLKNNTTHEKQKVVIIR